MNKKVAALLFAIGLGAASSPVVAASCKFACAAEYNHCVDSGRPLEECTAERAECWEFLCGPTY